MNQSITFTKAEKYFYLRRLHSLSGLLPIGLFFLEHLYSNAISLSGPKAYNEMIEKLMGIPLLPFIEIGAIALPILFHVILGIAIYLSSKSNVVQYSHLNNWRYFLQRVTGLIGIIYISYHVWETRIQSALSGQHVSYERMQEILHTPGMFWFYLIGALSLTFHFCNGLWTMGITWGLTVTPRSQKINSAICGGLFVVLSGVWIQILCNFVK